VWALGTRDCSLQRRHQKVIEEAPAPGLTDELRHALDEAAVGAARAIGYRGAGTVEFLVGQNRKPHFLEMNTRLQVEHPVTECVYGVDLVALQLRVAEGEPLPAQPPRPHGHAVEARLYAEDPAAGWRPGTGTMHRLAVGEGAGLRVDSGLTDGDDITVHYDPMLAKVIAWAPTRAEAVRRLAHGLERARLHGPVTNRDLLVRALRHPEFQDARMDTGFLERHLKDLTTTDESTVPLAALAAALADAAQRPTTGAGTVAGRLGGWRNVPSQPQLKTYRSKPDGTEHKIHYRLTRDGLKA
ncbi:acety-l/propionyl-CoA carboxylase subunit alpha, partial [Streptomyces sp. 2MCAF27]